MSADARLFSVHDGPLTIEDGLWIMEYGRAMGVGQWHGRQTTHNGHGQWAMGYGQWGTGDKRQSTDGERQAASDKPRATDERRRATDCERQATGDGRWTGRATGDGRRTTGDRRTAQIFLEAHLRL